MGYSQWGYQLYCNVVGCRGLWWKGGRGGEGEAAGRSGAGKGVRGIRYVYSSGCERSPRKSPIRCEDFRNIDMQGA